MIRQTSCIIARTSDPCRNLAIEKHLMDTLPEGTAVLFLYRSESAMTVGRNQNPWYECNVEPFLETGGTITRRLTGGGTFYQDSGTLNFSVILPKTELHAPKQLALAAHAAASLGLPVQPGPSASLVTDGRIFCTNAFYKAGSTALHNGSLLVSPDMEAMSQALLTGGKHYRGQKRPDVNTLYTAMSDYLPDITLDRMEEALYKVFSAQYSCQPVWLDEQMLSEANLTRGTQAFANPDWVYPEALPYNFVVDERFPWGNVTVMLLQEGGIIRASRIFSDAMEAALFDRVQQALTGCPYLIGAIGTRFQQRLGLMKDPRLVQIAGDVCKLICGRIRSLDRQGENA